MTIYYEQQLLIEQAKQTKKDRELALELKSRKLYPSEQKYVDEAMQDLLQMEMDELQKTNRKLDASMAESKVSIAKLDSLSSSSRNIRSRKRNHPVWDDFEVWKQINKQRDEEYRIKENSQQEGKNRKGRYTSSSFNYEVKAFDRPTTTQRERKSLGIPQGMRDWDHKGFTRELERKLGVK